MTDEDIAFIERELALTLPESYRRALVPFRVPALYGSTDYELWDDAEGLVRLNRELRAGSRFRPAWPHYLFAVGDPHGDEMIAVDTRDPDGPVWWLDHGMIDHESSYQSHARFADWVEEFYRDIRQDLEGDGFDPDEVKRDSQG
ncbi:MAG TPA: SMI1/KNR4 family protein [Pyrinomonadaceae bacterium]|nr:SMI1/KNR4 family protein [Pyrinomonadaceae bacterium]